VAHSFVGFNETYWCNDDGGVVKAGVCVGAEHGQWTLTTRIPEARWFIGLGIPAVVAVFIWKIAELMLGLLRRLLKRKVQPARSTGIAADDN
jgi:hypothetical protein